MDCLNEVTLNEYTDGALSTVQRSLIRDHLIVCETCRLKQERYQILEKCLAEPIFVTPPDNIERNVMRFLFRPAPSFSSVFSFVAASFLLMVTGIYIYFDFANNSLIQAFQLTSQDTSNWLASSIKAVSTIFSSVYAVFKAINKFISIILNINLGVEIIGVTIILMAVIFIYYVFRFALKKVKGIGSK